MTPESFQNDLEIAKKSLYNEEFLKLTFLKKQYNSLSNSTIAIYVISFILSILATTNNLIIIILSLLSIILLYVLIFKSQQTLEEISKITNRHNFSNIYISLFLGFPFYIFIYLYNRNQLKEAITEFNN